MKKPTPAPIYQAADQQERYDGPTTGPTGPLPYKGSALSPLVEQNPVAMLAHYVQIGVDPEKLGQMMDLADRWQKQDAKKQFTLAMNRCQSAMQTVVREKTNTQTNRKYAPVEAIQAMAKPFYSNEGFTLIFSAEPGTAPDLTTVHLHVTHVGGHTETTTLPNCPLDDKGPKGGDTKTKIQGLKSSLSYAKGILICLAFNITVADEDKDGADGTTLNGEQVAYLKRVVDEAVVDEKLPLDMGAFLSYVRVGLTKLEDILQTEWDKAKWGLESKVKSLMAKKVEGK